MEKIVYRRTITVATLGELAALLRQRPASSSILPRASVIHITQQGTGELLRQRQGQHADSSLIAHILALKFHLDSPKMQSLSFLNLPPELRNRIYSFALVQSAPIKPNVQSLAGEHENSGKPYTPETVLSVARTCKQIHNEAIAVYYADNTFEFDDTYALYVFLHIIGADRRSRIERIRFTYQGMSATQAFELLSGCPQLHHLTIIVSRETTKGSRHPQRDLLKARGMAVLRRLRGLEGLHLRIKEAVWDWNLSYEGLQEYQMMQSPRYFSDEHIAEVTYILKSELAMARP